MSAETPGSVTQLLTAIAQGDPSAESRLWSIVYDELRRMAHAQRRHEGQAAARETTSLVNEAALRLLGAGPLNWANRRHFFAAAAEAMRRIRVDDARRRNARKRGAGRRLEPLRDEPPVFDDDPIELLALDQALEKLGEADPDKALLVKLRFFADLSIDETAALLNVSPRKVDEEWRFARAWLHRELRNGDAPPA